MTDAIAILETTLRKGQGHFTPNEAAAVTGLSLDAVKDALEKLIEKYVCRLSVTENADLIYDFGKTARRRGEKSFGEIISDAGDWLWKVFTVIFKVWIAVTLVVYFVLFVIILIALLFSKSSDSDDNAFGGLFDIFASIFRWSTHTGEILHHTDKKGYRYKKYEPKPAKLDEKKKSFIASVYDFVFGPQRVEIDPLNNEKEVAAYLKEQKGLVVTAELEGLAGWTLSDAQAFFTDCLVRFQGDVKVSENGVMYGEFDRIMRGVGEAEGGKIIWYWDEYEPEYELTGNTPGRNFAVMFMNGFNLIFSFYAMTHFREMFGSQSAMGLAFLGWLPFVFSLLFFLIPLMRLPKILNARKNREKSNIRKRIFRVIFAQKGEPLTVAMVSDEINHNTTEEFLPPETIRSVLDELVLDLAGDTIISEQTGELQYVFPRIRDELETVIRLRNLRHFEKGMGKIIADSE